MSVAMFICVLFMVGSSAPALAGVINLESRPDGSRVAIDSSDVFTSNKDVAINAVINNFNLGGCCGGDKTSKKPGNPNPPTTPPTKSWILLVGGITNPPTKAAAGIDDVELYSTDRDDPIPACLKNLQRYPLPLYFSAGSSDLKSGNPFVCGGSNGTPTSITNLCYGYHPGRNTWTKLGRLPVGRSHQGASTHPALGLLLSGGHTGTTSINPVWSTRDGLSMRTSHEPMPVAINSGCQVTVDDDTLMFFGGGNSAGSLDKAYEYKIGANKWNELPAMGTNRIFPGCGVIRANSKPVAVMVAGGNPSKITTERFDLASRTWSNGPSLPHLIVGSTSLPYKNTFMMIGGHNSTGNLDTVYVYDQDANNWRLLPERMSQLKREVAAIPVSRDMFPNCG